jgi:FkbM family methyltransferase
MASTLLRAGRVLRSEGPREFLSRATTFASRRARKAYWRFRGERTVRLDDTTATFATRGRAAHSVEFFLRGEGALVRDMMAEARPDDVLWDVGANIGFHSAFVGQHVDHTVAFEPVQGTAEELVANLERNDLDAEVRSHALSDTDGELTLTHSDSLRIPDGETVQSRMQRGETTVAEGVPRPTMLKIDVEGAEGNVLAGMGEAIADCRVAYVEIHREVSTGPSVVDFGFTVEEVYDQLRDHGFDVEELADRDAEVHVKATR